MKSTTTKFTAQYAANLMFTRTEDGHVLSFSSMERGLVHFDEKGNTVKDYGSHCGLETLLQAIKDFTEESDNNEG